MSHAPIRPPLLRPGILDVLYQAKRDFVGKDVQQATTYSYVWSADQGGHFMLGFIPPFILNWIATLVQSWFGLVNPLADREGLLPSAGVVMVGWLMLELYDFYDSFRTYQRSSKYFPFNKANLAWNVITALIYFSLGAGLAMTYASCADPLCAAQRCLLYLVVLFPLQFFFVGVWWMRIKIIFQQAGLPYLYRLANFDGVFSPKENTKPFTDYLLAMSAPPLNLASTEVGPDRGRKHLIITGPLQSGTSSLAAGVATEFAFEGGIGRYITMSDLVQSIVPNSPAASGSGSTPGGAAAMMAAATTAAHKTGWIPHRPIPTKLRSSRGRHLDANEEEFDDGRIIWKWELVDLLIIDDVVELLLPLRRRFVDKLQDESILKEALATLGGDADFLALLKNVDPTEPVLQYLADKFVKTLAGWTTPETVAQYIASVFGEAIEILKGIPRVVWVVGDSIKPDLFEQFVQHQFGVTKAANTLCTVGLLPPEQTGHAAPPQGN